MAELQRLVDSLRSIPNRYRAFTVSPADAEKRLGLEAHILDQLVAAGLPHTAYFDNNDLENVSLYLGARSPRHAAMMCWVRSLRRSLRTPVPHEIRTSATCASSEHRGPCAFSVHPALHPYDTTPGDGNELGRLLVHSSHVPTLIPEHIVALFAELSDVAFYLLPAVLRDDVGFLRTNRMGECSLMARELVRIARQSGLEVRTSYGLIVSVPFSTTHTWAELRIDGVWMPVDLLLPRALHAWKITTDQVWPERLSPRGLFHRLTATAEPLVAHGDALCRVSFSTGIVS